METVIDRMKRIDSQSAIPSKAVAGAGKPDEREQAIVDRHVSKAPGVSVLQRAARIDAKAEIDTRKQQRAYAEKPPTTIAQITVDPAREMVANLGDRAKVLDTIRKMSPEQREEALKLAPGIAQQLGDDRGGAVGRTLGAVSRGISHGVSQPIQELIGLGGTPDEIEYIRQLDAAASQEFAPARPGDPWYQSGPLQAAQMAPWMATVVGGAGIGRQGATALAGRIAAKGAAGGKIAGAVTQAGKVVGKTGLTAGKAGELAGTAYAAFPSQYAQEVDQLKALGMQDGTNLRLLAGGTAAIGGLIEGIVPNPFKAGNVPLTEGALKAARQYLFNAAKQAPGEMTEEYLQGVTSGLGEHVAQYIDSTAEDKSIGDAFRKGWEQTKEAALPMAFLLGVPAIGGAGLSAARARLTRLKEIRAKGPVSRTAGRELGINDEKQEDRTAKADAEIQQLEQEAAPPSVTPEVQGMLDQLKQTVPPKEESAPTVSTAGEVPLVRADQTASGQQPPALPPGTQRATPWYDFGTGEPTGPVPAPPGLGLIDRLRGRSAQGTPPVSPPASLQERMDAIVAEGKAARQRGDNTDALKAEFYRLQAELNKTQPAPPALPQQSVATQTTPPALPGTQPPALPKGRKPQPPLPKGAPDASQVPTNEGSNDVQRNGGKGSQVDSGSQVRVEGQDQGGAKPTSQEPTTPEVQVEPPRPQADEPPIAEGMTRLYHGSATPGRTEGKAWFSTDRRYAENYRGKETSELQYVDVPTDSVNKKLDPNNYGQTVDKGFTWNEELDSSETGPRKIIAKPPVNPGPKQTEATTAPSGSFLRSRKRELEQKIEDVGEFDLDDKLPALQRQLDEVNAQLKEASKQESVSERDQAEDELAGLFGEPSPPKPTEQPTQESKPTAPVKPKQPAKTDWKLSDRVLIPEGSSGNPKAPRMVGAIVAGSISSDSVTVAIDGGGQVRLKKEELQLPDATFEVGEQVAVPWVKGVDDAPAKIMGVLPDGRYDVQFASGRRSPTRGDQMIKLAPSTPGSSEEAGTKPAGPTDNQSSEAPADKPITPPAKLGTKGVIKPARKMEPTEEGRPADGKPIIPGDRFVTNTGRETTPYPKYSGSTNRQAINAEKKSQLWLMENAIAEAESRGDDFNLTTFRSELEDARKGKLPQASKDSATLYVFGESIPEVPKPLLKPLVKPQENLSQDKKPSVSAKPSADQVNVDSGEESKVNESLKQNDKVEVTHYGRVLKGRVYSVQGSEPGTVLVELDNRVGDPQEYLVEKVRVVSGAESKGKQLSEKPNLSPIKLAPSTPGSSEEAGTKPTGPTENKSSEAPADNTSQEIPLAETFDDIAKLPKHSVYQRDFRGSRKFMVRSDGERGGGDGIFDTEQEARKYADTEKTREKERDESEQRRVADEAESQRKEQEYVESFKGFDAGSPMKFGKSRKVLEKQYNDKGTVRTRKEIIEDRIANGWTIKDGELRGPDGLFFTEQDLTSTGMRYAEHLLNDAAAKQKPSEPAQPESKWQSETRAKLEAVPALKGAKVEADEKAGTVKVTRPDGLATTIQFNADEELAQAARDRGRNPESIHGWYIRKPGEKQGRILVHSKANHTNILNHEVMHWLEDTGVVTKEEVEQYGGREEIANKYGKWVELKQRKKDSVFQRIYDALEPVFSSQARFFEEVGARKAAKPQESLSQDKKPSVPEPTGEKDKARIAEIDKELERLQAQYEKKSKQQSKSAMVPPSIKADALSQITKKMDILDAEKKALQSEKPSPEPTGEQDTGTSRGQSGEQVGNKGAKEQARENLRRRGKKKPSQADLDAETAAVIREREADNKVRQEFQADRDAQKAQDARREFVGKQKALANPATVDSLGFGDIAQVNDDIERGRVSYDDAIKVADAFVEAGYLPQLRRDQIRKPAEKAVAEPIEASVANEEDELASLYAQSEKMYNEVELLQNAGKDREANALIREAEKLAPRIKELEAPRIKAKQDADATAEEERRKRYNEKEDARKAALPTKQTRNGWELATDSVRWYLRDPNTKEIIYEGKLTRVREVADEAPPDAPTNEVAEAEARAERDAKLRERLKTLDYDNLRKLNKDAVIQVGDEVISDIGGLALEELSRRMDEAEAVLKKAPHVAALRAALGDDYANRHGADFDRYFNEFDSLDEDAKNREYRSNERRGKSFQSELGAKVTYAGAIVGLTEDGMRRVMDAMKQGAKAEKPYPERPHGETGDELIKRIAGREWHEVTKADFLRWAAGEYIAGGARKDKLVDDYKLGTEEQRRAFHEKTVANAIKEGKYVPPEVLADYQKTAPDEQSQGMVEVIQIFKNAVRFSVDSDIPPSVPQKRSTRTDGVEYIEVTNPYLDRIPNVKEAIALRKQQASEATSSEQEVQSYKRGDIVSAFGRDEAKVLIPDLGDLSYKKGNVRIEMTSGANKGKTMDVEPSDIRPLAEEDTIAGKAAKEASDKAAAKRVADEKIYNDMRDELLPLIRRIKKSGVTLNPKTKKAKKELVDKVMMGTQNRNEKMIQEAIDIVAAEKAEESVNEVPKRKGKRLGLGDTFTDSKTGKQFTIDEVIHKNWGLSTVSEYKSALINLNDGGWVDEIGNRKVILEKMVLAGIGDESTPEQEPQKQEENEPEPVPVQADFMEMSNGVNAPGVKQTIRVTAGERTLLMERSKHDSEWSIKEADEYTGEVKGKTPVRTKGETFVSGIAETKKAKEIAQRIIDGTFDKDADSRFVREDTQNIGLTNTGLADSMKDSLQRRDSFAKLLREEGLFTDGRLLLKVNEKDRDAILKRVGETDEGRPLGVVAQMLSDGRKALSRSANAMKPIGYRGGELTTRTVVLQSQDGDAAILDKALHDTILKKYPDAIPYFLDDGKPVSYVSNDDVVAIVMPMNMDKPDAKVKELIAGKYDFEAEAAEAAKFPPPAPKTKLKQAAEKANEELAKAVDEFGNVLKGKLGTNLPLNPEVIAAAAKVVAKAIQAGTLNFAELMERMVTKYGEKMAERMRGALQQEWDKQVNSNPIAEDGIPPKAPQPHPELVQPEPIPLTSVKNAIVDELRIQRGEAPMPEVTPETVQQWLELAGNRIANDPYAGNTLVEQLLSGGKTSVDEMEGMVLQYHYRAVNNLFTAADAKLTEAKANGDPAEIAIAQDEARVIMRRLAAIETALDKAGTAWGRAGVSRQIFLKQDFSLGAMVRRARVANGGNELSDKQVAIISEQADRIEKLQKQLAELEAKVEASAEQEQAKVIDDAIKNDIEDTKKPTAAKPKSKMRIKAEERLAFAWEKFGAVAKGKLYSNPIDPELLAPALEVVKAYLDLGIVTFREFMSTAAQNMGAKAAKASETTFRAAWDQLKEEGELAQPALDITNVGQLTRFARNVQRTLVENGITEREEVVDSVHEALQEIVPEITRRQTMDALSSYGQFAQLSKDPIDQIIRDINGQLQQLAKLEDMEKGQAPAKTGVERRSPTDEERRLTQLVNEAKRRGGFVVTDPETQLKSAMAAAKTAVKNRIADMNYEIKTGSRVVRNKTELIPDAELEQLRKDRDELQKVHKEMFPPKGATQAQKIASASRALDAAIANLEAKLAVGDISPAPQPAPLSTPELDAKRARLKELHEQRDALRKIAKPNMTAEQIKIRSLDKSIEALEKQLAAGNFAPKPKPTPLTSPEIDARQAKLEELRATKKAILDAANPKMTPEQRASRAYEAHLRKQLAMYLEKIAQGDFAPKQKKPPRVLTQGELALKKQLADVKHDFFEALSKYHLDNLSPGGRAIDIVRESAHLSRAIMTSIDLSAVLRQGGLGVYSHPVMARKAAGEMWHSIWSREKEFQSMEKLRTRPNAQLYEESGLNITDSEGKLTRQEEAFMGRWARTGIDFAGSKVQTASKLALEPVAASARAYVTFINNLRADLFDVMVDNLGPGGQVTPEEAKVIASYINVATGRSDLKSLNEKAATLNTVFFAPRYVASRFQYLAMPFYLMGTKDSGRVKKLIAKEYARTFAGAAVFIGSLTALAYLAAGGDDEEKPSVEFNPLSSDFGKVRIDETRLDPLAGLAQVIVFSSRMLSFHTKSSITGKIKPFYEGGPYETTHGSEAWRFLRTKFAPVPGAVVTAFSGMKDVVGDPVTPAGLIGGLFVPISVGEVLSTMKHRGIPKGLALNVLNLMGAAVNTYGPKTAYLDATPEERAKQVNDYIKYMNWESDLPAFSQYLKPEDLKRVQNRQDERRGDLVFEALDEVKPKNEYKTEVHYEEAVERHEKLNKEFEDFRKQYAPTFADAVRYLGHHFDDEGGIKIKGTGKKKPSYKERYKALLLRYQ